MLQKTLYDIKHSKNEQKTLYKGQQMKKRFWNESEYKNDKDFKKRNALYIKTKVEISKEFNYDKKKLVKLLFKNNYTGALLTNTTYYLHILTGFLGLLLLWAQGKEYPLPPLSDALGHRQHSHGCTIFKCVSLDKNKWKVALWAKKPHHHISTAKQMSSYFHWARSFICHSTWQREVRSQRGGAGMDPIGQWGAWRVQQVEPMVEPLVRASNGPN